MLRITSDVPPSMVLARLRRKARIAVAPRVSAVGVDVVAAVEHALGAHEVDAQRRDSWLSSAPPSLPIDPSGPGSPIWRFCEPACCEPDHLGVRPQPHQPVEVAGSLPSARLEEVDGRCDQPEPRGRRRATDEHPLVHQRGHGHPPAVPDIAERSRRGPHVGEVHLVELGPPVIWRSGRTSTPGCACPRRSR